MPSASTAPSISLSRNPASYWPILIDFSHATTSSTVQKARGIRKGRAATTMRIEKAEGHSSCSQELADCGRSSTGLGLTTVEAGERVFDGVNTAIKGATAERRAESTRMLATANQMHHHTYRQAQTVLRREEK